MLGVWTLLKILSCSKGLQPITVYQPFPKQVPVFTCLLYKSFENTVGAISPFPKVFSICLENFLPFSSNFKLPSANSFSLEESKICFLGKG